MSTEALRSFIEQHARLFVLTGAGCSTESGIPDYRDHEGQWKRTARPVTVAAFLTDAHTRRRYWARSLVGWPRFRAAHPNCAHRALARLQQQGRVAALVTQNVDRLHQAAGSVDVIDLHGRLDRVRCLHCERRYERDELQEQLQRLNPAWAHLARTAPGAEGALAEQRGRDAPDGDAQLAEQLLSEERLRDFQVPSCPVCAGLLKPDVVFFGESVPNERVECAFDRLQRSDAMLVVGSSLMLYSGYRFAREAARLGKPIAAVNLGRTRADELLALKVAQPCAHALQFLLEPHMRAA